MKNFKSIEICAGAGGQALGLEKAGFQHVALVEIDKNACNTLRYNRPNWKVFELDVHEFDASAYQDIDLFAGGVPCPPFSVAGKQLGEQDERDLFPQAIRIIKECNPKAILLENVKGLLSKKFDSYRKKLNKQLEQLGYFGQWRLITSSHYGVPQLRPRAIYVGLKNEYASYFEWPKRSNVVRTVGETLYEEMASAGWDNASSWKEVANGIAPTLVGGSKKHGGADLGPTRAKQAWKKLGVDGKGIANESPPPDFEGMPRLTIKMAALIQGFPKDWVFTGKKTPAYRQIGNAFPPPVAEAIGKKIISALNKDGKKWQNGKVQELNFVNTL
ncbi:MAG: DNA cytosine methyltransferase [Bacteroidota bacterium]